uniref:FAM21/CAPZIP domain-containing protein n=1 Tax=Pavo cristatus TaxID=9049 RepID=A0A8C9FIB3_PAVCR
MPTETNSEVDKSASPSVAQLAGKFKEQAASITGKEVPAHKPTRRKPPCSLSLYSNKTETSQNNGQKPSPNACPIPKVKVKSSPMIEKLQANLAFAPAALLPGASPKSPGLKVMVSPFSTPPSTPSSPGIQPQSGEASETPVSFDKPPEGTQLQFYNKVGRALGLHHAEQSRRFMLSLSYGQAQGLNTTQPTSFLHWAGGGEDESSSRSENEEKEEKQAEEVSPCKSNAGDTEKEEEEVCCGAPGEENSPQSPSEDKEDKVCEASQEKEEEGGACEQEKGDKEKEEGEEKETSESTVTQRTSDTEVTPLAPQLLQEAVGLETASEPLTSPMQDQGTE